MNGGMAAPLGSPAWAWAQTSLPHAGRSVAMARLSPGAATPPNRFKCSVRSTPPRPWPSRERQRPWPRGERRPGETNLDFLDHPVDTLKDFAIPSSVAWRLLPTGRPRLWRGNEFQQAGAEMDQEAREAEAAELRTITARKEAGTKYGEDLLNRGDLAQASPKRPTTIRTSPPSRGSRKRRSMPAPIPSGCQKQFRLRQPVHEPLRAADAQTG